MNKPTECGYVSQAHLSAMSLWPIDGLWICSI